MLRQFKLINIDDFEHRLNSLNAEDKDDAFNLEKEL